MINYVELETVSIEGEEVRILQEYSQHVNPNFYQAYVYRTKIKSSLYVSYVDYN